MKMLINYASISQTTYAQQATCWIGDKPTHWYERGERERERWRWIFWCVIYTQVILPGNLHQLTGTLMNKHPTPPTCNGYDWSDM